MYNRYISDTGPIVSVDQPGTRPRPGGGSHRPVGLLDRFLGGSGGEGRAGQALDSLLRSLHLEHLDAGDILLGLIVLFLVLEDGDDLDLIIALALTILLNLGEP